MININNKKNKVRAGKTAVKTPDPWMIRVTMGQVNPIPDLAIATNPELNRAYTEWLLKDDQNYNEEITVDLRKGGFQLNHRLVDAAGSAAGKDYLLAQDPWALPVRSPDEAIQALFHLHWVHKTRGLPPPRFSIPLFSKRHRYPLPIRPAEEAFIGRTLRWIEASYWAWSNDSWTCVIENKHINAEDPTLRGFLALIDIPLATEDELHNYEQLREKWDVLLQQPGTVLDCDGPLMARSTFFWSTRLVPVAPLKGRRLIVESELEGDADMEVKERPAWVPLIRCFALDLKTYALADIRDVVPHVFDTSKREKLVLAEKTGRVLDALFQENAGTTFGDLFNGRHGGAVILAHGPPGVGKTLTAEVYAETVKRPLYVLELGELGIDLEEVEDRLRRVFTRVNRWNAVLLFDEADIFLSARGEDLERSAIVGVFLRVMDTYPGIMFLTTNREAVLDEAFKSRITASLHYPALDAAARHTIWRNLLEAAGLEFEPKEVVLVFDAPEAPMNGRAIRNSVRLLTMMFPNVKRINEEMLRTVYSFLPR